jgi:mannosyltransferase
VLPVVATSMLRGVSHVPVLSPAEVTGTLGGWLFGFRYPLSPFQTASACGVVAVAIGVSLISGRNVRNMVLAFVVWPLAFAAAVSLFVRPIWIPRVFEFCVPFVCIAIGHAFAACWKHFAGRGRLAVLSVGAMLALSMATAAWEQAEKGRKMEYREAAAFLSAHAAPGDVIYAPDFPTFWGLARYMAGPAWGSPLTIQDPVRPTPEPTVWDKLYAWLGPDWLARLDLVPGARTLGVKGAKLVVGWTPDQEVKAASRVWVVGSHDTSLAQLSMCRMASDVRIAFRGIQVFEVSCKPGMS